MKNLKALFKGVLSFFYFFFKNKNNFEIIDNLKYSNLFFGYYDVSSFDKSEDFLALHGQKSEEELDILIYNIKNKTFEVIDSTTAWNYQQGSRLMWFGDNEVIYNKYDREIKAYYSVVKNIENGKENRIPYPLQSLYNQKYLLSINYSHLTKMGTEYGYKSEDDSITLDSLIYVDLENENKAETLFKIKDCFDFLKGIYNNAEKLHFNHFLISPDGTYFIFIFRFYSNGLRKDNLFGFSFVDEKLELLIEDELISHCAWRGKDEFILWGIVNNVSGYYLYNVRTRLITLKLNIKDDGHPTFVSKDIIITDTYPNRVLCETLSLVNIESGQTSVLLKVRHPAFYNLNERCDLHPSISASKTKYQIDFINKGKRNVCIGDL
ncbi:hypothetical protein CXF59_07030 [Flavobacterium sp. ALD4]|uniref:hypothetical protein n=1 Tax=Flavobacterium sp. ALD4 TaxID=2058314 RepID=UPI000C31DAC4|nr:hypothetical protein [Flavobacterium sp. ALD4]PKH67654.1 hypothetical protein CXF59_07030 [Flavobacterium sp. ALD4]